MYEDFKIARPEIRVDSVDGQKGEDVMEKILLAAENAKQWAIKVFGQTKYEKSEDGKTRAATVTRKISKADRINTGNLIAEELVESYKETAEKYKESQNKSWSDSKELETLEGKIKDKGYNILTEEEKKRYGELTGVLTELSDGAINEWIGYAPTFKDAQELDYNASAESNVKYEGMGQLGIIMLDFQWNSMVEGKGFTELAKSMYNKKMWEENGSFMQPPTFREVLDVTLEVVGNATGHKWVGYLDDALFAMTDLTGGYKSAAEVGLELGKKALTSAISYGASSVASTTVSTALSTASTAANVAAQAGISMASSYATSVANSAINCVYINEDGNLDFAGETFGKSLYSASTIGGALGAGVSAGLNTGISAKLYNLDNGAAINKFYGSAINLGVSAAGKTAEYATYLAYAGGDFSKAYDDMGGLSFNILDAGVFADMIATNEARTNSTGQGGKWGEIAQRLKNSNAGMFEINIGRKGITGKIGQGGMNLAGSLYDFGKRMNDKAALEEYAAIHDEKIGSSVMKEYIYGDWTQENAAARLVSGLDDLEVTKAKGFTAKTTSNGHGGRHIVIQDTGNDLNNAVQLGHEAYRDGVVDENNVAETVAALFGHTNMAANMDSWDAGVDLSGLLGAEVAAYRRGDMNALVADAMINYDSSKDYWKVLSDGNLMWDGQYNLVDENGNLLEKAETKSFTASFAQFMGLSKEDAQKILSSDELNIHYENGKVFSYNEKNGKYDIDWTNDPSFIFETSENFKAHYDFQLNYADNVLSYGGSMSQAFNAYQNDVLYGNANIKLSKEYLQSEDYLKMLLQVQDYASSYDNYMSKYFSRENHEKYTSDAAEESLDSIATDVANGTVTNNSSGYDAFVAGGVLNPVDNENVRISTKTAYDDGTTHLFGKPKGFSVDIARSFEYINLGKSVEGSSIYTNADAWLYSNSVYNHPENKSYGSEVRLFSNNSTYIYGHMETDTAVRTALRKLSQQTSYANLWRTYLPAGSQIGKLGSTGNSDGPHLHWEYRSGYQGR